MKTYNELLANVTAAKQAYKAASDEFTAWCAEAKKAKNPPPAVRRALKIAANAGLGWAQAAAILNLDCKSQSAYNKLVADFEDLGKMDLPVEIRPKAEWIGADQDKVIEWLQNIATANARNSA